ncbi:MAG: hypothetical protein ABS944_03525 [Solibacillus sp.]|uniref:hypothetical protein n=1 Tax=unclassified Solibacillus TaxID=2637870 RepID=UPI0030F7313A
MSKKLFYFVSAIVFVISFGLVTTQSQATNIQVDVNESKGEQIGDMSGNLYEKDGEATTFGWPWTAKDKTVKKEYATASAVPESIYYEEYIDGKWYSGTLKRTGEIEKLQYTWRATFTGKINY